MKRFLAFTLLVSVTALALALAPAASAAPSLPGPVQDMADCLYGPQIPETFTYYIVWDCTAGMYVPEPVGAYTGCRVVFAGQVVCSGGASDLVYDLTGCRIGFPHGTCQV